MEEQKLNCVNIVISHLLQKILKLNMIHKLVETRQIYIIVEIEKNDFVIWQPLVAKLQRPGSDWKN